MSGEILITKVTYVADRGWILATDDEDLPHRQWWLITMVILAVGLSMGVHGTIRLMLRYNVE